MRTSKAYNFPALLVLLVFFIGACTEQPPLIADNAKMKLSDFFGHDSAALFRGHQIGDTAGEIRLSENSTPLVDTDSLLQYHFVYDFESDSTEIDIFYTIDSYGLFEIQVDLNPKTKEGANIIMAEITEILNGRYGRFNEVGLVRRWTTNSPSNEILEITLSNESEDYGTPFISLNFLEPLPNEI